MLELQRKLVESLRNEAKELLDLTDHSDKEAWYSSPCTQALIKQISADVLETEATWAQGGYTDESAVRTLQLNSKHIGMALAGSDVLEAIDQIKANPIKEDTDGADPEATNG